MRWREPSFVAGAQSPTGPVHLNVWRPILAAFGPRKSAATQMGTVLSRGETGCQSLYLPLTMISALKYFDRVMAGVQCANRSRKG